MALGRTQSVALAGLEAHLVSVEADVGTGLPKMVWTGLPDTTVRESAERIRSAVNSSREPWPAHKITIGLLPASVRKKGSGFDLAIAVAVLAAEARFEPARVRDAVVIGELGLDGRVRPVTGVLPAVIGAVQQGCPRVIVPRANANEARLVPGAEVLAVGSLAELCAVLRDEPVDVELEPPSLALAPEPPPDLVDVVGQSQARHALGSRRPAAITFCSPAPRASARRCWPSGCPACFLTSPTNRRWKQARSTPCSAGCRPAARC